MREALAQAGPVLLEPIMKLEISTPDEHVGDLVGVADRRHSTMDHRQAGKFADEIVRFTLRLARNLNGRALRARSFDDGKQSVKAQREALVMLAQPLRTRALSPDILQGC